MRVLALGGSGAMGAAAVRAAVALSAVTEVVVADRDLAAAQRLADGLNGHGAVVRARRVDVTETDDLLEVLNGADVVLNTVGPYYRFGLSVLRAAIRTRTHYLDICDDWEPTARMLELDAAARDAGVCAIIGMGASPGVSNLLAARAARELDRVENVYTAWPVDVPAGLGTAEALGVGGEPSAAAVHWMQQISGSITVVRDGRPTEEAPLRAVTLALPRGRRGTAYTVGHPEPVTLHRSLAPSGDAANLMVVTPGTVAYLDVLRTDIDKGRLTNESAARELAEPSARRALRSLLRAARFPSHGTLPPFFAAVTGSAGGEHRTVLAHPTDGAEIARFIADMARSTGIPLALGLAQLLDGTARAAGVHPPEAIIDPERFFTDLGIHIGLEAMEPVVSVEQAPTATLAANGASASDRVAARDS
ncbi:saccharopine dehydrogenase family protein [Nocardia amikacinitolerans]|uniref:saccharopine dehydrogenase family protein n=1 Tax=Nocardia amikacinitolerans TaxID=756689 RepID=UPI0020A2D080|nr:saccharopine dehydrogenase NADP-binding domain-containing protein [Nocardia amikacinitolerans]MCP2288382.1 Saccharopine dehydrogenase, NADP-dependent [Nocardia amikacinitolerans]